MNKERKYYEVWTSSTSTNRGLIIAVSRKEALSLYAGQLGLNVSSYLHAKFYKNIAKMTVSSNFERMLGI